MASFSGINVRQFSTATPSDFELLRSAPALLWTTDATGRLRSVGGAALAAAHLVPSDWAGKPVEALFNDQAERAAEAHRKALAGIHTTVTLECGGREYEANLTPLYAPDGSVEGTAGAAIDVTDHLVADRALRISEQSYRALIEEAPYAICRSTLSGQLLQVNGAMVEILGYGASGETDLLMQDLPKIFSAPLSFDSFRDHLLSNDSRQALDSTWIGRPGTEIHVRVSGRAVREGPPEFHYLDIIAENVTEKKQLEAQLSQAHKMQALGQLAGGVAHDFNNLLMVIGGQVEMILCDVVDPNIEEKLRDIRSAAARAAALTRQLLAFSRRQVLESRVLDVNDVVRHSSDLLSRLIREDVQLVFNIAPGRALVRADPNQIGQVLMNLAINAQDAMPAGGRITISTTTIHIPESEAQQAGDVDAGDYIRIVVSDTGHGMDAETAARIFEPFFTTKPVGKGTGLGLAMVYGVVRQSGGRIGVETRPGAGASFLVDLPQAVENEPTREDVGAGSSRGGTETILLAEDEKSVSGLVETYLERLGYRILTAHDGAEAVEMGLHHAEKIDLLITDVVMPGLGGREVAAELRRAIPDLKVMFVSGYAGDGVSAADLESNGVRFLQKPFTMTALAATVREVLDRHAVSAG